MKDPCKNGNTHNYIDLEKCRACEEKGNCDGRLFAEWLIEQSKLQHKNWV